MVAVRLKFFGTCYHYSAERGGVRCGGLRHSQTAVRDTGEQCTMVPLVTSVRAGETT